MGFDGKRVIAFETRRGAETAELIRRNGGDPFVAPSVREVAIENNPAAREFARQLSAGEFDAVIFLTGVGVRYLAPVLDLDALRRTTVIARGPKPLAALRELGVPVQIRAPEPNTWREVVAATEGHSFRRVALQEYGKPADELIAALRERGSEVTPVMVYQWELPEDTGPLREAARRIVRGEADMVVFTTSQQLLHLLRVAGGEDVPAGLRRSFVASIGPTTTATLREHGIEPRLEASVAKLGVLIKEAGDRLPSK